MSSTPNISSEGTKRPRLTTAEIEAVAADWVLRTDAGLDDSVLRERARWLSADPAHAAAFSRLSGTWDVFARAESRGVTSLVLTRLESRQRQQRLRRKSALAGVVACLVVVAFLLLPRETSKESTVALATNAAEASTQTLPDGSVIELHPGAQVEIRYEVATRRVRLVRGEALFRVQKDPRRPFLVEAGHVEVGAVGTAFHVRLDPDAVEVLVTEGRVRIVDPVRGASLLPDTARASATESKDHDLLLAGERATVDFTQQPLAASRLSSLAPAEIETKLAWRTSRLDFEGMPLREAIQLFNRHNLVQIVLSDPKSGGQRISGTFRSDNPEGFVHLIEATFGLRASRTERNVIVLSPVP